MAFDVWFLSGLVRLSKHFAPAPEDCTSYPRVSKLTSHTERFEHSQEGLKQFAEALSSHGQLGHCLLQGPLSRPIKYESRAGLALREEPMQRITFDVDGVIVPGLKPVFPMNEERLTEVAEAIIEHLPVIFHDASYVVMASSSFGLKPYKVSIHIHFLLEYSVSPSQLRDYLKIINLKNKFFFDRLDLTASGNTLRWPLDVCTAQNSRILYIAPPTFHEHVANPFPDASYRYLFVQKAHADVDIIDDLPAMNDVLKAENNAIAKLRKLRNLPPKRDKFSRVNLNGDTLSVVTNPDPCKMEYAYERDNWVYYNINGGDSNAYWVDKYLPAVVHNFKGEPAFSFQDADPDTYQWHINKFIGPDAADKDSTAEVPPIPIVGIDYDTDAGFKALLNPVTQELERPLAPCTSRANMDSFMVDHGQIMPNPVPTWTVKFDPHDPVVVDLTKRVMNRYQLPKLLQEPAPIPEEFESITYGGAQPSMRKLCPTIARIVYSLVGDDDFAFDYFINWLAWIVINRDKTRTAWLLHGVQGTGKGVLYEHILQPIIGDAYTWMIKLRELENNTNAWVQQNILTIIDEFKLWNSSKPEAVESELKNLVTDPFYTMRALHRDHLRIRNYANFILYSNSYDILHLDVSDRRFNVAPRQPRRLIDRFPDIEDQIRNNLPEEVPKFATFLAAFSPQDLLVHRPMENEAKAAIRRASTTNEEDFFLAIRNGEFAYFLPILEMRYTSLTADWILAAKNHVKAFLHHAPEDDRMPITTQSLAQLYQAIFGKKEMTAPVFGKKLARWGFVTDNLPEYNARGIYVTWNFEGLDRQELKEKYAIDFIPKGGDDSAQPAKESVH